MDTDQEVNQPFIFVLVVLFYVVSSMENTPYPRIEDKSTEEANA